MPARRWSLRDGHAHQAAHVPRNDQPGRADDFAVDLRNEKSACAARVGRRDVDEIRIGIAVDAAEVLAEPFLDQGPCGCLIGCAKRPNRDHGASSPCRLLIRDRLTAGIRHCGSSGRSSHVQRNWRVLTLTRSTLSPMG